MSEKTKSWTCFLRRSSRKTASYLMLRLRKPRQFCWKERKFDSICGTQVDKAGFRQLYARTQEGLKA
ncbi:hypothetical protein L596_003440 [Steinernema carpocapsae]|uniref:Uncharacterized protein n=1 Tax=Steinernema carpocapsae TaxID=34508 RepID=A0A4U8USH8_STECR|nr:hypothetical protein L596_003440 [Steinernema carpocapsae]